MSLAGISSHESDIELSDASAWNSDDITGASETGLNASSPAGKDGLVPLQLEDTLHHHSNDEKLAPGWRGKMTRALRINQSAGGMSLPRALLLVGLSFFFVLTTSLLVTGFQGLLPALIKDGVRRLGSIFRQQEHRWPRLNNADRGRNSFFLQPVIRPVSRLLLRIKDLHLIVSVVEAIILQILS